MWSRQYRLRLFFLAQGLVATEEHRGDFIATERSEPFERLGLHQQDGIRYVTETGEQVVVPGSVDLLKAGRVASIEELDFPVGARMEWVT